ncbi:hypothetical protein C8F01DRAFT_1236134 [Mycena amicta]|nr:hypothetical protein C8F01DRAFT_1236134 [Mycena amicta]
MNLCSEPGPAPAKNHTTFLIVSLICPVVINLILLVDIELTLIRNTRNQSRKEDEWGFGQVLALLLLVVPLRDFVTSIRDKLEKEKLAKENLQNTFNDDLRQALDADNLDDYVHRFKHLIDEGANPNVELDGENLVWLSSMRPLPKNGVTRAPQIVTLLQFAAYKGKEDLIEYLLRRGVKDRTAFEAAARQDQIMSAHLLGKARNEPNRAETRHRAVRMIVQALRDSNSNVHWMALACLGSLGAQLEFQDEIQAAIPVVVEALQDGNPSNESWEAISIVLKELEDSSSDLRSSAIECIASLGSQVAFQAEIRAVIPTIVEALEDSDGDVRRAAFPCIAALAAQANRAVFGDQPIIKGKSMIDLINTLCFLPPLAAYLLTLSLASLGQHSKALFVITQTGGIGWEAAAWPNELKGESAVKRSIHRLTSHKLTVRSSDDIGDMHMLVIVLLELRDAGQLGKRPNNGPGRGAGGRSNQQCTQHHGSTKLRMDVLPICLSTRSLRGRLRRALTEGMPDGQVLGGD